MAPYSSYVAACVFVVAGKCLWRRCLATIEWTQTGSKVISRLLLFFEIRAVGYKVEKISEKNIKS
jgi:hypothetical protein